MLVLNLQQYRIKIKRESPFPNLHLCWDWCEPLSSCFTHESCLRGSSVHGPGAGHSGSCLTFEEPWALMRQVVTYSWEPWLLPPAPSAWARGPGGGGGHNHGHCSQWAGRPDYSLKEGIDLSRAAWADKTAGFKRLLSVASIYWGFWQASLQRVQWVFLNSYLWNHCSSLFKIGKLSKRKGFV